MKGKVLLAASLTCFLIASARGQSDSTIQLIAPNRGLLDAPASIPEDSERGTVLVPPPTAAVDPIPKKINDPDKLIPEASKISSHLPGKVLAKIEDDTYQTQSLGPESVNEFLYISEKIVSVPISKREDYNKVMAAFKASQEAFDKAHVAFNQGNDDGLAAFYSARDGLMDALVNTLILIENLYGEIRKKKNRTTDDKFTQDHFVRLAGKIRGDISKLRSMGAKAAEGKAVIVEKAVYGFDDNFDVYRIDQIYRNTPAIAMVRDRNNPGKPIGTAFLAAKNVIVTAEHCVKNHKNRGTLGDLEFVFFNEYGLNSDGIHIRKQEIVCAINGGAIYGSDLDVSESFSNPDFAIFFIAPPADAESKATIESIKPLRLSLRNCDYGDALCGIGHPEGRYKQVHLNCRVLLPFQLRGKESINAFATRMAEKFGIMDRTLKRDTRRMSTQSDREREFLATHYSPIIGQEEDDDSLYHIDRTNNLNRPAIAIEADTFAGDSGAPIIDINTNAVIGILVAGQPNSNEAIAAVSLEQHEVVLPIKFVIDGMGGIEKVKALGGAVLPP